MSANLQVQAMANVDANSGQGGQLPHKSLFSPAPKSAAPSQNDDSTQKWAVHKFGGTSVQNAECITRASEILTDLRKGDEDTRLAVVVSAMGGKPKVTQLLLDAVEAAASGAKWDSYLETIKEKHCACLKDLNLLDSGLTEIIEQDLLDLDVILKTAALIRHKESAIEGYVAGHGERWSALIISKFLGDDWVFLNAREVLRVKTSVHGDAHATVMWTETQTEFDKWVNDIPPNKNLVITGYIASDGVTGGATTLGRDGSDYSASIFGVLTRSTGIWIWTDVSGVMSADPRRVRDAYVLDKVSYDEASELAYFGAKVIHPKTMQPAAEHGISIFIKNSFRPNDPGTEIKQAGPDTIGRTQVVCAFSTVENLAVVNVIGQGFMGIPGFVTRTFGAIAKHHINISLIAQASSEQTICFCVPMEHGEFCREILTREFRDELESHFVSAIEVMGPCSILAAVGDGMSGATGVAGQFFSALGNAQVNILAIAQGPTEGNMSALVHSKDASKALQAVHAVFKVKFPVNAIVIGSKGMSDSLNNEIERIRRSPANEDFDIRTCETYIVQDKLHASKPEFLQEINTGMQKLLDTEIPHPIIIDASLDETLALEHKKWLDKGFHVITSNVFGVGHPDPDVWGNLKWTGSSRLPSYTSNVAVSGGLNSVLGSIERLMNLGNILEKVEALIAAPVQMLLEEMDKNSSLSVEDTLKKLQDHPEYDDLCFEQELTGHLGACRLLTLGRELGLTRMSLEDITVEPVPMQLEPPAEGKIWRYVGRFSADGKGSLRMEQLDPNNSQQTRLCSHHPGNYIRLWLQGHKECVCFTESAWGNNSRAQGLLWHTLHIYSRLDGCRRVKKSFGTKTGRISLS